MFATGALRSYHQKKEKKNVYFHTTVVYYPEQKYIS